MDNGSDLLISAELERYKRENRDNRALVARLREEIGLLRDREERLQAQAIRQSRQLRAGMLLEERFPQLKTGPIEPVINSLYIRDVS